ncbi:ribonuclease H [Senna tora]|uniref:Ribonuclease H n=1 Tax=Senna tora TaxID=362788 RepID=A0A835CI98_9FABA|nr:ribonuclease H [Senna tora]
MLRDLHSCSTVADLIQHTNHSWNVDRLNSNYDPSIARTISNLPLSVTGVKDRLIWTGATNGYYNVKDGYNWLLSNNSHQHTASHTTHAPVWQIVWRLRLPYRTESFSSNSIMEWFSHCLQTFQGPDQYIIEFIAIVLHIIWRCRNVRVMEGKHLPPTSVIKIIDASWRNFRVVFSNHHQKNNLQSYKATSKRWSTATSLPNSGIVIITATRKLKPRGSIHGLRKILLRVLVNNQVLAHMVYTLRDQQDLKVMHLLSIKKGIQIAINYTGLQGECNIIVFKKGMADLLTVNYKHNVNFQVWGRILPIF